MRIARYETRVSLTLRAEEYAAAHRRFGRSGERLRLACTPITESNGQHWFEFRITSDGSGNLFYRHSITGDWVVQWPGKIAPDVHLFPATDVGKFDPDKDGVDLVLVPTGKKPRPARRRIVSSGPTPKAPKQEETPVTLSSSSGKTTETDTISTHVSIDQLRHVAAIYNAAIANGIEPIFENGRIVRFKAEIEI